MKKRKPTSSLKDDAAGRDVKAQQYTDRGTSFDDDAYREQPDFENEEDLLFDDSVEDSEQEEGEEDE